MDDNQQRPKNARSDWTPEEWDEYYTAIRDACREVTEDFAGMQAEAWAMACDHYNSNKED